MSKNELNFPKLKATKDKLTAAAGLGTLMELFDSSPLKKEFIKCLPERNSSRSAGSYLLALATMASFIYGHDCLEDLDEFRNDPSLKSLFGDQTVAARTLGDFLRDFDDEHLRKLNLFLNMMSRYVMTLYQEYLPEEYKPNELIIDVDSTSHVQHGDKMEGLAYNYKNEWCLDSQVSFNQMGLCHGFQLRSGNTKSGVDSESLIRQSFIDDKTQVQRKFGKKDFFRADSAYCKQDVIKALLGLGVQFTLTAHDATTNWKDILQSTGVVWQPWVYTDEEIKKADLRKQTLPKIEVTRFHWTPTWSEKQESKIVLPIIVKRTWNVKTENEEQKSLFYNDSFAHQEPWDYYAVVTNFQLDTAVDKLATTTTSSETEKQKFWSIQEVFAHHQKRGNSENFIKEEKYAFDLKHFPCLKLSANYAFGLLAMVSHNILRWVAVMTKPEKPHYSKKLRRRFISIPAKLVHHARQVYLKMMNINLQEVFYLRETLRLKSETIPPQFSTA
jgi:hypothetical protein